MSNLIENINLCERNTWKSSAVIEKTKINLILEQMLNRWNSNTSFQIFKKKKINLIVKSCFFNLQELHENGALSSDEIF